MRSLLLNILIWILGNDKRFWDLRDLKNFGLENLEIVSKRIEIRVIADNELVRLRMFFGNEKDTGTARGLGCD